MRPATREVLGLARDVAALAVVPFGLGMHLVLEHGGSLVAAAIGWAVIAFGGVGAAIAYGRIDDAIVRRRADREAEQLAAIRARRRARAAERRGNVIDFPLPPGGPRGAA